MAENLLSILEDALISNKLATFREFVTLPNYCNNNDLYNYWLEQGSNMPLNTSEIILDGSIGGGKTTFSNYYFAYRVYRLFAQGSPQAQLHLALNTEIYCLYFSVSLDMAKKSGFMQLYNIFNECAWFNENYPIDKSLKSSISFPNKFHIDYASSESHQIGLSIWGFILDEANFRSGGVGAGMAEEYQEVTLLYNQLMDRLVSRFSNPDGSVNALAILISSASYQSSFVEKRKQVVKDDKWTKCITSVSYEVKPERYASEKFEVFIGSGSAEPCIIDSEEQKTRIFNAIGILGTGEEDKFIRHVPINLLKNFKDNIALALQNHCGVPTMVQGSFMSNMKYLYESYVEDIPNIFSTDNIEASTDDDTQIIEYIIPNLIQYPDRPHSLYLDLSMSGDRGCLTCYRYDGRVNNLDMHTRVFCLRIIPPHYPASTKISKVQQFVFDISQFVNLVAFASDQFQSESLRQEVVSELALENIRISLDSTDRPFLHWQRGLVEGRIRQSADALLEQEVQEAVHDYKRHRVIKAKNSSDDILQSNVGAFFLSDTFGKAGGGIDDLYGKGKINIVGGRTVDKILRLYESSAIYEQGGDVNKINNDDLLRELGYKTSL